MSWHRMMRGRVYGVAQESLRRVGLYVRRSANTLRSRRAQLLKEFGLTTVVDVGANLGQYAKELRSSGYTKRIVSFEPIPQVFAALCTKFRSDANHECHAYALGSFDGNATIHVAAHHASSSLLKPNDTLRGAFPGAATQQEVEVSVRRFDSLRQSILHDDDRVHLKIDTQGSEQEVLRGATESKSLISTLELELSLVPLYEEQPLIAEICSLASELGFELVWLEPGVIDHRTKYMLQVDALFVERSLYWQKTRRHGMAS